MPGQRKLEEKRIQNSILREFGTRTDMRLWRNNVGQATFGGQSVQFGVKGQADLSGLAPSGRRLEVEVKTWEGKQSTDQFNFEKMIKRFNGIYILARSIDDVYHGLRKAGENI